MRYRKSHTEVWPGNLIMSPFLSVLYKNHVFGSNQQSENAQTQIQNDGLHRNIPKRPWTTILWDSNIKTYEIFSSPTGTSASIVVLVKTWLSSDHVSASFLPDSFNVYRADRKYDINFTRGSGVLFAVSNNWSQLGDLHRRHLSRSAIGKTWFYEALH